MDIEMAAMLDPIERDRLADDRLALAPAIDGIVQLLCTDGGPGPGDDDEDDDDDLSRGGSDGGNIDPEDDEFDDEDEDEEDDDPLQARGAVERS